ncbi:MAG TPA: retroviral-like aspartic protease family protein [Dehalococcoidia bacterium]|nr:retroviral-like aspartic protease family protein [Dehalococcoidia bacterium]
MRVPLRITNPDDPERTFLIPDALVDTGATSTCVPAAIAESLGLRLRGSASVRTAEGVLELAASWAELELQGKRLVTHILISDTLDTVLIGVTTLEGMGFAVDPRGERLVPTELLLL